MTDNNLRELKQIVEEIGDLAALITLFDTEQTVNDCAERILKYLADVGKIIKKEEENLNEGEMRNLELEIAAARGIAAYLELSGSRYDLREKSQQIVDHLRNAQWLIDKERKNDKRRQQESENPDCGSEGDNCGDAPIR